MEEMDGLAIKVRIRIKAHAARIPVLMVTDNGDNAILDVERFDPDYALFHGAAGELEGLSDAELTDPRCRVGIANAIAGSDTTPRTRFALTEVGRSLPSWPQLGTAWPARWVASQPGCLFAGRNCSSGGTASIWTALYSATKPTSRRDGTNSARRNSRRSSPAVNARCGPSEGAPHVSGNATRAARVRRRTSHCSPACACAG